MAIQETTKVLTIYQADTKGERAEIDKLIAKVDQLKKTKAASARADEQHFDQLVLDLTRSNHGIQEQAMSWDGLHKKSSAFGSALGGISSGIGKLSSAMTPLNQGLELAGKAMRFADEAMGAYAKTSVTAAKEVEKVRKEFAAYRDAVMQGAGRMAVELLKPAASYQEHAKRLLEISKSPAFKILYGDKGVLTGGKFADELSDEFKATAARYGILIGKGGAVQGLTQAIGGAKKAAKELFARDTWNPFSADEALGKVNKALDESIKKQKKAREEWLKSRDVADFLAGRGSSAATGTFTRAGGNVAQAGKSTEEQIRAALGFSPSSGLGEAALANARGIEIDEQKLLEQVTKGPLSRFNEQTSRDSRFAASQSRRTQSFLEQTLGPIDEFSVYAEAFNMLGGAVGSALNAWVTGSMSAGDAFKKFISEALTGLASQMAVEALKHTAYAIGSAAFGDAKGAATHGAAAVAFGFGSAAALVASKALGGGGSAATGAGASGGASTSTGSGAGTGGGAGSAPQPTQINYILVGSDHAENSPRMMQSKAQRLVSLADNKTSAGGAF